ncbi:MAG: LysM peptidoglycan-binding domain-containing protein [Elusimicrobiota bacterium]|nr:LysM peptidoglycan-binding domain-containing protein [Elusimicrobiota bacterium]
MRKIALTILACVIPAVLCAEQPKLLGTEKGAAAPAPEKQSAEIIPVIEPGPAKVKKPAAVKTAPQVKAPRTPAKNGALVVLPKENSSSTFLPSELVKEAGISPQAIRAGGFVVGKKHKIHKGDTLWDLSGKYYNDPFQWGRIYSANFKTVPNPDLIHPKEELIIPDLGELLIPYRRAEAGSGAAEGGATSLKDLVPVSAQAGVPGTSAQSLAAGGYASASRKSAQPEPGETMSDFDRGFLSEEMPEHQTEWSDGMKVVTDSWSEDGEITAKLKGGNDSMDDSFSLSGEAIEISMDRSGIVKPGDYLTVYLKGGDAYDKSGKRLGRELQPAGMAEVVSVDGTRVKARVIDATTAILKGYIVKKK